MVDSLLAQQMQRPPADSACVEQDQDLEQDEDLEQEQDGMVGSSFAERLQHPMTDSKQMGVSVAG